MNLFLGQQREKTCKNTETLFVTCWTLNDLSFRATVRKGVMMSSITWLPALDDLWFTLSRTFPGLERCISDYQGFPGCADTEIVLPLLLPPPLSPPGGGAQLLRCSWSFLRCFSFCFSILSRAFLSFSAAVRISLMRRFRAPRSDELSMPRACRGRGQRSDVFVKHWVYMELSVPYKRVSGVQRGGSGRFRILMPLNNFLFSCWLVTRC